ncbi:DUF2799 domain-containing protein [Kangiella sediminilitoris]|uniref:DUF2799 domain-containing protein n=1 Tax=Kangiella sediminilitoris TaxID=1144748 RepID=A0A1B3BCU0_9GAMM|nr:DUF2799 domain-containing protein [Kangiella sediminilitoris]AOE50568.1 hypothetical protein KS2013_1859 [Kangiella sediminilitoris]
MNLKYLAGGLIILGLLSGCATLSETECVAGNWQQIGYQDGKFGRDSDYVLKHESACMEYGVQVDREAYEAGRQQGLDQYCTANNGFNRGSSGSYPNPSCNGGYPGYHDAYYDGLLARNDSLRIQLDEALREHEVLTEVQRRVKDEEEVARINHELEDLDAEINSITNQIDKINSLIRRYRPQ